MWRIIYVPALALPCMTCFLLQQKLLYAREDACMLPPVRDISPWHRVDPNAEDWYRYSTFRSMAQRPVVSEWLLEQAGQIRARM